MRGRRNRKGNVLVLSAVLMVVLMVLLAFALDVGYVYVSRSQLQRSADAAAMAAAWELMDTAALSGDGSINISTTTVRNKANEYAGYNYVLAANPQLSQEDVTIGYIDDPFAADWQFQTSNIDVYNAVNVRVRRHADQNGEVPLLFARFLGHNHVSLQADATAAMLVNIRGFATRSNGQNQNILPFALDEETWLDMLEGGGADDWTWDEEEQQVVHGADGIRELNLYPEGTTGSPSRRGKVDIGSEGDVASQIVDGATPADLDHHGGSLELDENGELTLSGAAGISDDLEDELASIQGKPRVVPIFRTVEGPGGNATYTIVAFAGVRILEVELGGASSKRVMIQPANVVIQGAIPGDDSTQSSYFVYSPVWLVR